MNPAAFSTIHVLYIWKYLCQLNFAQMAFFLKICNIPVYVILCPDNYLSNKKS